MRMYFLYSFVLPYIVQMEIDKKNIYIYIYEERFKNVF